MRGSWTSFALLFLVAPLFACGGGASSAGTQRDSDVITLDEIQDTEATSAYQVVQQLRPRWMYQSRGARTFNMSGADYMKVTVDGMPPREFEHLNEIPREVVLELRLLSAKEATFLFGTGFNRGLIKVTTKR